MVGGFDQKHPGSYLTTATRFSNAQSSTLPTYYGKSLWWYIFQNFEFELWSFCAKNWGIESWEFEVSMGDVSRVVTLRDGEEGR
jgi:hypothetical protein